MSDLFEIKDKYGLRIGSIETRGNSSVDKVTVNDRYGRRIASAERMPNAAEQLVGALIFFVLLYYLVQALVLIIAAFIELLQKSKTARVLFFGMCGVLLIVWLANPVREILAGASTRAILMSISGILGGIRFAALSMKEPTPNYANVTALYYLQDRRHSTSSPGKTVFMTLVGVVIGVIGAGLGSLLGWAVGGSVAEAIGGVIGGTIAIGAYWALGTMVLVSFFWGAFGAGGILLGQYLVEWIGWSWTGIFQWAVISAVGLASIRLLIGSIIGGFANGIRGALIRGPITSIGGLIDGALIGAGGAILVTASDWGVTLISKPIMIGLIGGAIVGLWVGLWTATEAHFSNQDQ